ncbi:hypothetical protein D3C74_498820 [compost metagenome]
MEMTVEDLIKNLSELQKTQKVYLIENGEYFQIGEIDIDSDGDVTIEIGSRV